MTATATSTIPAELLARPQWVAWRWEEREGKPTKIPVDPRTRANADTTNAETWDTFERAEACARQHCLAGVGYVFSPDDPYTGIDLDGCRDSGAGTIAPWALRIVRALASYTEVTPSRTGLHVIVRGTIPGERRRRDHLEMYDAARFFTVTGNHLEGAPLTIEDRQDALAALYWQTFGPAPCDPKPRPACPPTQTVNRSDTELIEDLMNAANGAKFRALFIDGDLSLHGGNHSDADLSLLSMITFRTQDPGQVDRVFRASALYRDKWERVDYRERSIARALNRSEFWTPPLTAQVDGSVRNAPRATSEPPDDLPTDLDAARAEILELRRDRETWRAAALDWQRRYEREAEQRSQEARVRRNKTAKAAADPLIATYHEYRAASEHPDVLGADGFLRLPLVTVAAKTGRSAGTVAAALNRGEAAGLLVRQVRYEVAGDKVRTINYVKIPDPDRFLPDLAETSLPPAPGHAETWGGRRVRCPDHPDAPVIKRVTYHCGTCDRLLDRAADETVDALTGQVAGSVPLPAIAEDSPHHCGRTLVDDSRGSVTESPAAGVLMANGERVEMLRSALVAYKHGVRSLPSLLLLTVRDAAWRDRLMSCTGQLQHFERFVDFVTAPPLEGLGTDLETLRRVCAGDPAALAAIEQALKGDAPTPHHVVHASTQQNRCVDCNAPCGGGERCSACAATVAAANAERRRLKRERR